jgi:predicted Zn-dependent protease
VKKAKLPKKLSQSLDLLRLLLRLNWVTFLSVILTTILTTILTNHPIIAKNSFNNSPIQNNVINNLPKTASDAASDPENILPKPHPLPETLQQWQDSSGDYFSEIESIESVGYLIWSKFPVTVYIQNPTEEQLETFEGKSLQTWVNFVSQAVAEWSVYFPLKIIDDPETADIAIWRRRPGLRLSETGEILPARSAEAHYQLYHINQPESEDLTEKLPENLSKKLAHKFTILLSPTQTGSYIQSAAKHELGHALGIWGHSPLETDVMYWAQVRNSPPISPRDINTLQRIYQQPTYLGWPASF